MKSAYQPENFINYQEIFESIEKNWYEDTFYNIIADYLIEENNRDNDFYHSMSITISEYDKLNSEYYDNKSNSYQSWGSYNKNISDNITDIAWNKSVSLIENILVNSKRFSSDIIEDFIEENNENLYDLIQDVFYDLESKINKEPLSVVFPYIIKRKKELYFKNIIKKEKDDKKIFLKKDELKKAEKAWDTISQYMYDEGDELQVKYNIENCQEFFDILKEMRALNYINNRDIQLIAEYDMYFFSNGFKRRLINLNF